MSRAVRRDLAPSLDSIPERRLPERRLPECRRRPGGEARLYPDMNVVYHSGFASAYSVVVADLLAHSRRASLTPASPNEAISFRNATALASSG